MSETIEYWLKAVEAKKSELEALRPLSESAIYRLREELKVLHTYDSNAIEGSQLTLRETALVVKEGVTVAGRPISHVNAARGYAMGFDAIFDFVEGKIDLTEDMIKDFHRYVMVGANPRFCGLYRDTRAQIAGSTTKRPDFAMVPYLIRELVKWWQSEGRTLHPVLASAMFHARYEHIHPFIDGNGRSGRLLLNYQLVRAGLWPVNIRYAEERLKYYDALEHWDIYQDISPLVALIAEREIDQLQLCIEIAREQSNLC